jgi:hypothetical protein
LGASRCAASSETAAVRRAVTVGPSSISRRWPVATSNTTTSPWMVGRPVPALAGVKVMSLVMAVRASSAGITNRLPPPGRAAPHAAAPAPSVFEQQRQFADQQRVGQPGGGWPGGVEQGGRHGCDGKRDGREVVMGRCGTGCGVKKRKVFILQRDGQKR